MVVFWLDEGWMDLCLGSGVAVGNLHQISDAAMARADFMGVLFSTSSLTRADLVLAGQYLIHRHSMCRQSA